MKVFLFKEIYFRPLKKENLKSGPSFFFKGFFKKDILSFFKPSSRKSTLSFKPFSRKSFTQQPFFEIKSLSSYRPFVRKPFWRDEIARRWRLGASERLLPHGLTRTFPWACRKRQAESLQLGFAWRVSRPRVWKLKISLLPWWTPSVSFVSSFQWVRMWTKGVSSSSATCFLIWLLVSLPLLSWT